jgi:hypothetical protein
MSSEMKCRSFASLVFVDFVRITFLLYEWRHGWHDEIVVGKARIVVAMAMNHMSS